MPLLGAVTSNGKRLRPRPESSNRSSGNEPPQWILDKILELLLTRTGDERWQLEEISNAKSAQQQVFVLRFSNGSCSHRDSGDNNDSNNTNNNVDWSNALKYGKHRLVLRIWRGGSRWWNLNRNESPLELARSEINGYRVAFSALQEYHKNNSNNNNSAAAIPMVPKVPRVLHFHDPEKEKEEEPQHRIFEETNNSNVPVCWAVLEYVGADETDHLVATTTTNDQSNNNVIGVDVKIDRSYLEGMIKIRREFGFEEPHPRWGRVPVNEALDYASSITNQVLLPLHFYSEQLYRNANNYIQEQEQHSSCEEIIPHAQAKTFSSMVELYRKAWEETTTAIRNLQTPNQIKGRDDRIEECLHHLDRGILCLSRTANSSRIPHMDPVLLHLDLQPQNLIFFHDVTTIQKPRMPRVFSVLDWEDAAWGDPRFDLVLVCRKVCANRDQADALWSEYANASTMAGGGGGSGGRFGESGNDEVSQPQKERTPNNMQTIPRQGFFLGPIEPWLRLETVHSITTMLLQSIDLVNGGRNPWETKKDLWGKLEREFTRLDAYEAS